MIFLIKILLILNVLCGMIPYNYSLDHLDYNIQSSRDIVNDLADDSIVDLRDGYDVNIYAGTSGGLSIIDLVFGEISFSHFVDEDLPDGGNPSTVTYDLENGETMIVVSGVLSYFSQVEDDYIPYGTGIAWSINSGTTWNFTEQPTDDIPYCEGYTNPTICSPAVTGCSWHPVTGCSYQGSYIPFDWYGQTVYSNPITVVEKNVTYDLSVDIDNEYIYIASWAGMLRRLHYGEVPNWELVPLPEDIDSIGDEDELICGGISSQSYVYNPVNPPTGNHNHKPYAVHIEENVIWVGTANGINKGLIDDDGCIDWTHQTTLTANLAGDWIIDVVPQYLENDITRIWLISRELVSPPEPHGLTYSDDGGATWTIVNQFNDVNDGGTESAIVYNLYFNDNNMYAATDQGLYYSSVNSEQSWNSFDDIPDDCFNDTWKVYTFIEKNDIKFIGTPNGLIYECDSDGCGEGWCNDDYINLESSSLSIYPNPTQKYTNFVYKTDTSSGHIDIFDFSMKNVYSNIPCYQDIEDDGNNYLKCDYDNINLDNGVYFCRLSVGKREVWEKLMIINN